MSEPTPTAGGAVPPMSSATERELVSSDPLARPRADGRTTGHRVVLAAAWLGVLAIVVLGLVATPDERGYGTHEQLGLPSCLAMKVGGVPCPGCGVTTSVTLMAQGRVADAFWTQPFGVVTAVLLPLVALWGLLVHLRGGDLYRILGANARLWVVPGTVLLLAAWAFKLVVMFG